MVKQLITTLCLSVAIGLGSVSWAADLSTQDQHDSLPGIVICATPNSQVPSSAFEIFKSVADQRGDHWVRYQCKQTCTDWRRCLVPAYSDDNGKKLKNGRQPHVAKKALAFVVDGMGGHLAFSDDGEKTVFTHAGAGGTRYYFGPMEKLERQSSARTVMVRWEKGYVSRIFQPPFPGPLGWGWFSRTSAEATSLRALNARVASLIAWTHDNISEDKAFGTLGCSMGTNATFGTVLWHKLDPIIDYQLFVGGPNMWDMNAQCRRRHYTEGYCDVDGVTRCSNDSECQNVDKGARCVAPSIYTTIDLTYEQLPNHIHTTTACDIRGNDRSTAPYLPFDESSMGFTTPNDWQVDHTVDFIVNLGASQDANRLLLDAGIGGDEYWGLGDFPFIYNAIKPDENKHWHTYMNSHHCDGMKDEALDLIQLRMGL